MPFAALLPDVLQSASADDLAAELDVHMSALERILNAQLAACCRWRSEWEPAALPPGAAPVNSWRSSAAHTRPSVSSSRRLERPAHPAESTERCSQDVPTGGVYGAAAGSGTAAAAMTAFAIRSFSLETASGAGSCSPSSPASSSPLPPPASTSSSPGNEFMSPAASCCCGSGDLALPSAESEPRAAAPASEMADRGPAQQQQGQQQQETQQETQLEHLRGQQQQVQVGWLQAHARSSVSGRVGPARLGLGLERLQSMGLVGSGSGGAEAAAAAMAAAACVAELQSQVSLSLMPVPPEPQLQPQLEAQPEQPQPAGPRTTALPKPAAQLRGAEDVPAAAPATAAAVEGSAPGVPGGLASQWILVSGPGFGTCTEYGVHGRGVSGSSSCCHEMGVAARGVAVTRVACLPALTVPPPLSPAVPCSCQPSQRPRAQALHKKPYAAAEVVD